MTVDELIGKWWGKPGGQEKSNFSPFIADLCEVLGVDRPAAAEKGKLGAYEYEGSVPHGSFRTLKGTGAIDLYKRGHFIMEAKQSYLKPEQSQLDLDDGRPQAPSGATYDKTMRDARLQAENYARNLPASEPVAPFLIVCDIGRAFEIYVDTAGNGRGYEFFPDKQSYRIVLTDLGSDTEIARTDKTALELLKAIWTNPRSVDPRFQSAEVTRKVAANLAEVSKYLEDGVRAKRLPEHEKNIAIEETSLFLMRVLFCMFAEDIGLLPRRSFEEFLKEAEGNDRYFADGLRDLFEKMNNADPGNRFSMALKTDVRYFNGGLFEDSKTFPLGGFLVHNLYEAARQNWRRVEPAIFGTLLEQALDAKERAKLGAHYTPRPYVETLVRATIMDVLEPEWEAIEEQIGTLVEPLSLEGEGGAAIAAEGVGGPPPANAEPPPPPLPEGEGLSVALTLAEAFHTKLCTIRVLDPACGTGNFLYVAMELMQALESRVIERIQTLGGEARPHIGPQQFHGLELNPRAAKIAELVLWIGWLRNRLKDDPEAVPEPVLKRSANLNMGRHGRYDAILRLTDTGEPDYDNPLLADWPEADFIVGNPPFIGKGEDMRKHLGDGYVAALLVANPRVAASADFVMQWWDRAAHILVAPGSPLKRFGFVTTNSITQTFSRRVIENYLSSPSKDGAYRSSPPKDGEGDQPQAGGGVTPDETKARQGVPTAPLEGDPSTASGGPPPPATRGEDSLSLVMAIPDHPWTKATRDAAAVRIAMTVAERGSVDGVLREAIAEAKLDSDTPEVVLASAEGRINSDLSVGADATSVEALDANRGISFNGMMLAGQGFKIARKVRDEMRAVTGPALDNVVKPHIGGSELVQKVLDEFVIDFTDLSEKDARQRYPLAYEHILEAVKPERDGKRDKAFREKWWLFGRTRPDIRSFADGIKNFIVTTRTAKHRIFQFLSSDVIPNHEVVVIGSDDEFHLGVLQSAIHCAWAFRAGGTLEDRPRYNKAKVFDPFPFPDPTDAQRAIIGELAEELDETRKLAIAETDRLTMTELYNLREKLRAHASGGEALSDKDQRRATAARAGIVNRLHEQLDAAVADAYGWDEEWAAGTLGPSEIVSRLVALNHQRVEEERQGHIRWLRPDYQIPRFAKTKT